MSEMLSSVCAGREIEVAWKPEATEIPGLMSKGFIPIEMAEGSVSYTDALELDHHNHLSDRPAASVTALRYYAHIPEGEIARFMVNHVDADCVVSALTLIGLLDRSVHETLNREVGFLDVEPIVAPVREFRYGKIINAWKSAMSGEKRGGWSWLYGLLLFHDMIVDVKRYETYISKVESKEEERRKTALEEISRAMKGNSGRTAAFSSSIWGFDFQFGRKENIAADSLEAWNYWCLAARIEDAGKVTLSVPTENIAEKAFGKGGLLNVYPLLPKVNGKEWGGRGSVGGSPRGESVDAAMLPEILEIVDGALKARV